MLGRPSWTFNTGSAGMPRARKYRAVPSVARIEKPSSWNRRTIGVAVGLSRSCTVTTTVPEVGRAE